MKKIKALAIFNALSLIIHVAVVYMTQFKMINQKDVGEISAQYETLFTPAGFTFAIWGLLYVTLATMCLYHIVIAYKHDKSHPANYDLMKMGGLFILVNLASAAWLYAWTHEQLAISVALIVLQLIGLLAIHQQLHMYDTFKIAGLKICTQFPLSIYAGWISIATIANISSFLAARQWSGYGIVAEQWVVIMMSFAVLLSIVMILFRHNIYFGLAIAWGFYGIIVKRETVNPDSYDMIINTAWAGIGIILILSVIQLGRNISLKKSRPIFPSVSQPVK